MHIQILIISELKFQEMSIICVLIPVRKQRYISLTKMNNVGTEKSFYISHFRLIILTMLTCQTSGKNILFSPASIQHELSLLGQIVEFFYDPWKLLGVMNYSLSSNYTFMPVFCMKQAEPMTVQLNRLKWRILVFDIVYEK